MSLTIQPNREALWAKAFGVESLDGLFDMTPVEEAIPRFDAAIRRFNAESEELRPLLAADDPVGLRGNRGILIRLRKQMAQQGGTISGAADESEPRETM
ncbi:hypothetical protein [Nocardia africana]|uniref:hypothetical protein n=1 Tax=Nocardia africana TaxID=134964 RepID=UPI000FE20689|nr:hypothetical protein [Nocardia africana]MCC3311543.1 hypothetical protein [Nocardia africana]